MKELMILESETRINSVELVEIINQFRQLEGKSDLLHKNFMAKIKKEIKELKILNLGYESNFKESTYINSQNKEQPCYTLNSQAVKFILDSSRNRDKIAILEIFNKMSNGTEISVCKERPEYEFINGVINALRQFGIEDFSTQHYVCNKYRIDLYIPSLNVAIEFDERGHIGYTYEQQESRQAEIQQELGCKFIRVSDENDIFSNIGYVIKEILDSLKFRSQVFNEKGVC